MNIVIMTNNYPYGKGEEFLESEMKALECSFDKIYIITLAKSRMTTKYIPPNAQVITARGKHLNYVMLTIAIFKLFLPSSLKDLSNSFGKEYKYHMSFFARVRMLLTYLYYQQQFTQIMNNYSLLDKVQLFYSYWLDVAAYALVNINKNKMKFCLISRAHSGDCYSYLQYHPFMSDILTGLDQIYCISETAKKDLFQMALKLGVPTEKFRVSNLGILNSNSILNPIGSNGNEFVIVTCAQMVPEKRLDLIIAVLKQLATITNRRIQWLHFGEGLLFNDVTALAKKTLMPVNNIEFSFRGYVQKNTLFNFYQNEHIDLFLNLSDSEGIPVSIMEAMSFGIPVLARDVGGITEIVNEQNGIIVKKNAAVVDIANLINGFMKLPQESIIVKRKAAYTTFYVKFNAEKNYKLFINDIIERCEQKQK